MLSAVVVYFGKADIVSQTSIDWFSQPSTFEKELDYPATPDVSNFYGCTNTSIQVARSLISDRFEDHCLVPTAMGLMKRLNSTDGVVQPNGYNKAYPVNFIAGGNPYIDPIPNQASGLYITPYSQGAGVVYSYISQISNHLDLQIHPTGITYDMNSKPADFVFRGADGRVAGFNNATQAFSSNGRYMIVDTIRGGFARVKFSDLTLRPFSETLIQANGTSLLDAQTAIDDSGQFAAVAYNAPASWGSKYFKVVDVNSCLSPEQTVVSTQLSYDCKTVDLLPEIRELVPTVNFIGNLRFVNNRTLTFTIGYSESGTTKYSMYSTTAFGQSKRLKEYLALGDSYISGEGAFSYRDGTDTTRNQCHQSLLSYPYLLSKHFNSFSSVTCSGARSKNVFDPAKERVDQLVGENANPLEISSAVAGRLPGVVLQRNFVDTDNPQAVTISVAGNDIGFGQILERCVHPLKHLRDNIDTQFTCYDTYEDRKEALDAIDRQFPRLRSLYESMRTNGTGGRRVYVIGYPQIAKVGGDCGLNVQMNAAEIQFAHDLIEHLDGMIQRAADEAGVMYVDTQQAFDGHRLCKAARGQSAMNGFTISENPNGGRDFKASFHPNKLGHELLADVIGAKTQNLTKPMPVATTKTNQLVTDPNASILQAVPKSNRPIKYVQTAEDLLPKVIRKAQPISFIVKALDYQIKAGNSYSLAVGVKPTSPANFVADPTGDIAVTMTIPADTLNGFQTLHIYGVDNFGNAIDIQQVVFVAADPGDDDGDGLPNASDSCVLAAQSGVDADADGIDDVCDPLIAAPPVIPIEPGPAGIIWLDNAVMPLSIQAHSGP